MADVASLKVEEFPGVEALCGETPEGPLLNLAVRGGGLPKRLTPAAGGVALLLEGSTLLFWKKVGLTERNSLCVLVCVCVTGRFGTCGQKVAWARGHLRVRTPDGAGDVALGRRGCVGTARCPGRPSKVDPGSQGRFSVMETLSFSSFIPSLIHEDP